MFVLNQQNSIANQFLAEIRDISIQKDSLRFRRNLERIGELLAYELSKTLPYEAVNIKTPLAETTIALPQKQPVLMTILRAGIPFFQGFLNYFDKAESGFIGAFRSPHEPGEVFDISLSYVATPDLNGKEVILVDPMLATGKSIVKAIESISKFGQPAHLHIVSAIAAPEGIAYLNKNLKTAFSLWIGAIDEKLNEYSYIVPGLGDAGDLSYGSKI